MLSKVIRYFLHNKLVTALLLLGLIAWGLATSPFSWSFPGLPDSPVAVDAIPNTGENQQIVFTEWPGRSPQDIEDQITYPLTTSLLGTPGVKSVRSSSMMGFSSIYVIFEEDVEFYWSRSRLLEKLSSLPEDILPTGVKPRLGPDATALGQIFWYTLEGQDSSGKPTGGWDLDELRSVQDYYVKYGLNAVQGVAEVASVGGFTREYQIDVDPTALEQYNLSLKEVVAAARQSNRDVGAKTIEINKAEYLVRGLGYVKSLSDLEQAVVRSSGQVPLRLKDVAELKLGPASRRGVLDKNGAEVVGGAVVARYGANPLEVINRVKSKIEEISPGLPQKKLKDGRQSQLTIVPFYDRSELIYETIGTLEEALTLEVLISILVVIIMVFHLRASFLISSLLPVAVLSVFIAMRYAGVTANIVALSGIAIAIGTIVDLGIILSENILREVEEASPGEKLLQSVQRGASQVAPAILTAVSTTIVSFIPVFTLEAAEGKLFRPLAFTKTFALIGALLITLIILPTLAYWVLGIRPSRSRYAIYGNFFLLAIGLALGISGYSWAGLSLSALGALGLLGKYLQQGHYALAPWIRVLLKHYHLVVVVLAVTWLLAREWLPLGPSRSLGANFLMVSLLVGFILGAFSLLLRYYSRILSWLLLRKTYFLVLPILLIAWGLVIWLGAKDCFSWIARGGEQVGIPVRSTALWQKLDQTFPGIGKEFMPALDEGSFLLMPSSMPHSGMEYNREILAQLDRRVQAIPEVETVVGKMGRTESALDPAPISMFENVINYLPEYRSDARGRRKRFAVDEQGHYRLESKKEAISPLYYDRSSQAFFDSSGQALSLKDLNLNSNDWQDKWHLVPDEEGRFYRNWRPSIQSQDDLWQEIVKASTIPGVTSAPKLQPIETRQIMLQTGMRSSMGIKVSGPDLKSIQDFAEQLEDFLPQVSGIRGPTVYADKIVGKPYLLLDIDRKAIARHGLTVDQVQETILTAIGGKEVTTTVEGRERYPVRLRYPRELRNRPEALAQIRVKAPGGAYIPLEELAEIRYERGPQSIKSENTFLVGYVTFDKDSEYASIEVVEQARKSIEGALQREELSLPSGVNYQFSGEYENQVRAQQRLSWIVPLTLLLVLLILYFQFRSLSTSLMIFSGVALAFSGGFVLLWLYGQDWFLNFPIGGQNFRDLFQVKPINLSVAVWVGFIALFGIATDDGVLLATYLDQSFLKNKPRDRRELRQAIVEGAQRRVRPALMTVSTTLIALLPILSSTGRGANVMVPMAIPTFGGMALAIITIFVVPVLYCLREERKLPY